MTDSIEFRLQPLQRLASIMWSLPFVGIAGMCVALLAYDDKISSFKTMMAISLCGIALWKFVDFLWPLFGKLILTPHGVELKRWQTTMIPWKEIQSVQKGLAHSMAAVEFVLSDRSEVSWAPGSGSWMPDCEFDQKLQTIQQLHARFSGRMPSKRGS